MRRFLLKLRRRRQLEQDLENELLLHREMAASQGNQIPFGNSAAIEQQSLDLWRLIALEDLWRDVRTACRELIKRPAISVVAILSLALGIGANSAIFSYIDGLYLRPLAVPDSGQLARVFATSEREAFGTLSFPEFQRIQKSASFASLGAAQNRGAMLIRDQGDDLVTIYGTSADFFQMLGVKAQLGRVYGASDNTEPVAVLGHSAWLRLFGDDPAIAGKHVRLSRGSRRNVTIIGVLPASFRDFHTSGDRDLWMPPATFAAISEGSWRDFQDQGNTIFHVLGRLRPGVSVQQAQAELATIQKGLERDHPDLNVRRRLTLMSDLDFRLTLAGNTGLALLGVVLLVVAIACVNVANLLLARVEGRRQEFAIRAAIGANRWHILRQLLVESAVLGTLAALAGMAAAYWLIDAIPVMLELSDSLRARQPFRFDTRVAGFTLAISTATILFFGLMPAWIGSGQSVLTGLRRARMGFRRYPLRNLLAIGQVAVSLVLVSATALLVMSFRETRQGDIGLARKNVLNVWQSQVNGVEERTLLERMRSLPGVKNASLAFRAPLSGSGSGFAMPLRIPGHAEFGTGQPPVSIKYNTVDQGYFDLIGVRLKSGRLFETSDSEGAAKVVVISESMARRYWPTEDPIGKYLSSAKNQWQIVGVVSDAPIANIGELAEPYFYTVWWQNPMGGEFTLLLESDQPTAALVPLVRAALTQIDSRLNNPQFSTSQELIHARTTRFRSAARLSGALGILGVLLTAVGLYGVIAYGVTLRRREIGIRMALGAGRSDTARMVAAGALRMCLIGLAIGLPLALIAARWMGAMLFGVPPWHAPAFALACVVLVAVTMLTSWMPARRAAGVDPAAVAKSE